MERHPRVTQSQNHDHHDHHDRGFLRVLDRPAGLILPLTLLVGPILQQVGRIDVLLCKGRSDQRTQVVRLLLSWRSLVAGEFLGPRLVAGASAGAVAPCAASAGKGFVTNKCDLEDGVATATELCMDDGCEAMHLRIRGPSVSSSACARTFGDHTACVALSSSARSSARARVSCGTADACAPSCCAAVGACGGGACVRACLRAGGTQLHGARNSGGTGGMMWVRSKR